MNAKALTLGGREVRSATLGGATLFSSARYEELEYIEFDGIAYIDLHLDHVTGYEYELEFSLLPFTGWQNMFSTYYSAEHGKTILLKAYNSGSSYIIGFYDAVYTDGWSFISGPAIGERCVVTMDKEYFYVNGVRYNVVTHPDTWQTMNPALRLGSAPGQDFLFRVKDVEGNIISDCRPARRISDGECGMYDKVRGLFLPRTSERGNITGNYPTGRLFF